MKSVNIRELKNNPSDALRMAREAPVVVMNRDQPEALLFHLDDDGLLGEPGVRLALATRRECVARARGEDCRNRARGIHVARLARRHPGDPRQRQEAA